MTRISPRLWTGDGMNVISTSFLRVCGKSSIRAKTIAREEGGTWREMRFSLGNRKYPSGYLQGAYNQKNSMAFLLVICTAETQGSVIGFCERVLVARNLSFGQVAYFKYFELWVIVQDTNTDLIRVKTPQRKGIVTFCSKSYQKMTFISASTRYCS